MSTTSAKIAKKSTKAAPAVAAPAVEQPVLETVEKPVVAKASAKAAAAKPATSPVAKPAAKAAKKAAPAPEPVAAAPEPEPAVEAPKKKLTVARGEVTVLGGTKARKSPARKAPAAKSPAKPAAAKSPKRAAAGKTVSKSPAKPAAAKSPKRAAAGKKVAAAAKAGTRRVVGKGKGKGKGKSVKEEKPRRPHNLKPAPIDYAGIGIGPARVKKVLTTVALNPREAMVRRALLKAENKPVRPKPTAENPNPEMPAQGHQTPIEKLEPSALAVVREAEKAHHAALMDEYEREELKKLTEAQREAYTELRKEAAKKDNFNLHDFNLSQNKNFYAGFSAFCEANDSYQLGRKFTDDDGKEYEKYNQWTRATALINKLCTRLSSETRNILAGYLDNLVIQFAQNGLFNCLKEGRSIVQLRHALTPSEGFEERASLDPFARTLTNYQLALTWLDACRETREEARQHKAKGHQVETVLPSYPDPEYDEDFDGYVVDICRSVRIHMAEEQKVAAEKQKYLDASISSDFKRFCSFVIYESILRVGAVLKAEVALNNVKTVSEKLMYHALHQIHNSCGISFESFQKDLVERLARFSAWREARRKDRKDNKEKRDAAAEDDDEEEEEVAEAPASDEVADEEEAAAEEEADDEEVVAEEEAADDEVGVEYEEEQ